MEKKKWDKTEELVAMEEGEEEGSGAISLHAIKGVGNSKVIKVEGNVHNNSLMVLIDSGSTRSFINETTGKRMGCPTTRT